MTNNTIPNVPRDDLDLIRVVLEGFNPCIARDDALRTVRALLSAPSPAGVDGLEVYITDCATCVDVAPAKTVTDARVVLAQDAKAIIDGLRGENEALHAQVKVLQSDANSWQSGYDEGRRMGGKHCALTIDQQAQRIGKLEGLLRHAQKQVPTGSGLHMRIDAALSAGKEGE